MLKGLFNLATGGGEREPIVLAPGDHAPDFVLPGSDGRTHRLGDWRGREAVVLAWFPKAFTPGCTQECRSLSLQRDVLTRFQAQYFAATVDPVETARRFAASLGLEYPVLSDSDGRVARAYGVVGATGFPRRWTFYIGADGRIVAIDKEVRTVSHGSDIAARLTELGVPRRA